MDRRTFVKTTALSAAGLGLSRFAVAADLNFDPKPAHGWRVFEVTTRVEPVADGATRVWLPLPSVEDAVWIRPMGNLWQGNAASVQELRDPVYDARMLAARWNAGEPTPVLEVVSRFATRDRAIDLRHPGKVAPLDKATRKL
ncbi:MAG: transglutaminase, partial [Thiobacillus sp.]|nr:transglutaminase [Thiobacillus sp.]